MRKLIIDPHHCSKEELKELLEYLAENSWDVKELEVEKEGKPINLCDHYAKD